MKRRSFPASDPLNQDWNDQPNCDLIAFCCFSSSNNLVCIGHAVPLKYKPSPVGPLRAKALCFGGLMGRVGGWRGGAGGGLDGNTHGVTHDRESMEVNVRL